VAPVAGLISGKQVFSTGAVVGAGATLMTIIPDDQPLEVEAEVANADIGFVTEGQTVALKLDAFPFTRYGLLKGHIRSLNRDASDPAHDQGRTNGNGAPQFTFAARISIDEGAPSDRIRTGMRVRAEAKTGRQSVASYLLSPLRRTLAEAGRER
jgi:multidrug resistance efflux pump